MQKFSIQEWTQGQATKQEFRNVAQACKGWFQESQSSAWVEACRGAKVNNSFYSYIGSKRLNKRNVSPLWNGVDDLVTVDTEKAEQPYQHQQGLPGCCAWSLGSGIRMTSSGWGLNLTHPSPWDLMSCVQGGGGNRPKSQPGLCHLWRIVEMRRSPRWLEMSSASSKKGQMIWGTTGWSAFLFVPKKVKEQVQWDHISEHVKEKKRTGSNEHGLTMGKSCPGNLMAV